MLQLVLLLYFLAAISGAAAFSRLITDYRLTRDRVTGLYIRYFITYTVMVVGVGLLSYVRVNISSRMDMERLSASLILTTAGLLARDNAVWVFSSRRLSVSGGMKAMMLINVIAGILSGIGLWLVPGVITEIIGVSVTMTLFAVTVITTIVRSSVYDRSMNHLPHLAVSGQSAKIFALFSATAVIAEVLFLREYTINHGWFCSLPLVYMGWNIMSMVSRFQPGYIPDIDQMTVTAGRFGLTPKETAVVRCIMLGLTNHETSYELGITRSTVKNHITNIYRKTGVSGRVNLVNLIRSDSIQAPPGPPSGTALRN